MTTKKDSEWAGEYGLKVRYNPHAISVPAFTIKGTNVDVVCRDKVIYLVKFPTGIELMSERCKAVMGDSPCLFCALGRKFPPTQYGQVQGRSVKENLRITRMWDAQIIRKEGE